MQVVIYLARQKLMLRCGMYGKELRHYSRYYPRPAAYDELLDWLFVYILPLEYPILCNVICYDTMGSRSCIHQILHNDLWLTLQLPLGRLWSLPGRFYWRSSGAIRSPPHAPRENHHPEHRHLHNTWPWFTPLWLVGRNIFVPKHHYFPNIRQPIRIFGRASVYI